MTEVLHILARALRGGTEKNCFHFIKACPQFHHEVIILNGDGPMIADWRMLGVNVVVLDILRQNRLVFYRNLPRRLPPGDFDTIIVWTNIRMPVVMHALNKYKANVFVHIGNPVSYGLAGGWSEWMQSLLFPATNPIHLRPVSEYVQRGLKKNRYYNRFTSKVSLKPILIPDATVHEPTSVTSESIVNFGMVARLDPIKDHKTVLTAFTILLDEYPRAILNLVGSGPLMKPLKKFVDDRRLGSSVIFHGDVDDVYARMRGWDIFLYATTPREGLGGTIPEALAIGLPVIAADLPMIREWDKYGTYISYCNAGDAENMASTAKTLLTDVDRRKEIHSQAPQYIRENHSPEIFSYNYISNP
jgi:glycosyltransferase involved in cell wall biosynthesis